MMSLNQGKCESLLQKYYQAFNEAHWEQMLELLTEDVRHELNQGEPQLGKEAFRQFLKHMDHCYTETLSEIVLFASDSANRGAAEFIVNGIYKNTDPGLPEARGQKYRIPAGAFFEFCDGKISRVSVYYNLSQWLKAI